jgi:SAM-dependent methyltransferase
MSKSMRLVSRLVPRRLRRRPRHPDLPEYKPVPSELLSVPIERPDGSHVTDFRSPEKWQQLAKEHGGRERVPLLIDLIKEQHHRIYFQPFMVGRDRMDFLLAQGLDPGARLLDLGCGAGRLGVWLIRHLEPGRYFGSDAHLASLVAFSAYELRLHALADRRPRLMLDERFEVASFGERFDVVVDASVTANVLELAFRRAFTNLREVLAPGGRVFSARLSDEQQQWAGQLGWRVERTWHLPYTLWRTRNDGKVGERQTLLRLD